MSFVIDHFSLLCTKNNYLLHPATHMQREKNPDTVYLRAARKQGVKKRGKEG
jgi:hypothetical protein